MSTRHHGKKSKKVMGKILKSEAKRNKKLQANIKKKEVDRKPFDISKARAMEKFKSKHLREQRALKYCADSLSTITNAFLSIDEIKDEDVLVVHSQEDIDYFFNVIFSGAELTPKNDEYATLNDRILYLVSFKTNLNIYHKACFDITAIASKLK